MESGLDGRNNTTSTQNGSAKRNCLNGVRPRWPEQSLAARLQDAFRVVSMESGLDGRNNIWIKAVKEKSNKVSMESGLDGRNNSEDTGREQKRVLEVSMESGLDGRNNQSSV